jgi:hypothetical protein
MKTRKTPNPSGGSKPAPRALQSACANDAEAWANIPQPEKFPASFDVFLRLIVRAKTPADATKRFRDSLRDRWKRFAANGNIKDYPKWAEWAGKKFFEELKPEERKNPRWVGMTEQEIGTALEQGNLEQKVAGQMEEYGRGFRDQYSWCLCAKEYYAWWKNQLRNAKRASGLARAAQAKAKVEARDGKNKPEELR